MHYLHSLHSLQWKCMTLLHASSRPTWFTDASVLVVFFTSAELTRKLKARRAEHKLSELATHKILWLYITERLIRLIFKNIRLRTHSKLSQRGRRTEMPLTESFWIHTLLEVESGFWRNFTNSQGAWRVKTQWKMFKGAPAALVM